MKVKGKVVEVCPLEEGCSEKGQWMRRTIVVEYGEEFPRLMALTFFGQEKMPLAESIKVGNLIEVVAHVVSRNNAGKWFTDVRVSRVDNVWRS